MPHNQTSPDRAKETMTPQRIALFGGAFDPPHQGHITMASAACEQYAIDRLHWIPTARPPHKSATSASFEHRCRMLELVIRDHSHWHLDTREASRSGPSYFVDTLLEIKRAYPNCAFFTLIGEDQLSQFHLWHRFQDIEHNSTIIAYARHPEALDHCIHNAHWVKGEITQASSSECREDPAKRATLLPRAVTNYIKIHRLYGEASAHR